MLDNTKLSTQNVEALDEINERLQMLTGDIHGAYNDYFHDYKPEPNGLYPVWVRKIQNEMISDDVEVNKTVASMYANALTRHNTQSIFDAEEVLYDLLEQVNNFYRAYWQVENK